jgi:exodeoxyribonuclease V alpha subunit
MNAPDQIRHAAVSLLVRSVRNSRFGALWYGIDGDGQGYAVQCPPSLVPDSGFIEIGQMWSIEGPVRMRSVPTPSGFLRHEMVINAKMAELTMPSGQRWIDWIADSKECFGIGPKKARLLWSTFGADLERLAEAHDIATLSTILSPDLAERLCCAISKAGVAKALNWLDQIGLPRKTSRKTIDHWGERAREQIEANPYHLLAFEAQWRRVDAFARARLKVAKDDPRRLAGAVEQALYDGMALGHTCLPIVEARRRVANLLSDSKRPDWQLADRAMALAQADFDYVPFKVVGEYLQGNGLAIIEQDVADRILQLAQGVEEAQQTNLFNEIPVNDDDLEKLIDDYRALGKYPLNTEQRQAVRTSVANHLSLILGGAGTGKTTVLDAVYQALKARQTDLAIYQIALAGLAAERMEQATCLESMTIAAFLNRVESSEIPFGSVVVVDESSMVDVLMFHRLFRHLPQGVRLILVGDHCQLPGIGPGSVLHALAGHPLIPQTHLIQVTRQSKASGIPMVAATIRNHETPQWDGYHGKAAPQRPAPRRQDGLFDRGVSFISCAASDLNETVVRIYGELGGCGRDHSVQVLSPLKNGPGGVHTLNWMLHGKYQKTSKEVMCKDREFGLVRVITKRLMPLREGDLVMFTQNDYDLKLRNGSLGRVVKALPVGEPGTPCCEVIFDGRSLRFTEEEARGLEHAYCLTVHKAQGNQFRRVIIPLRHSKLLDHSMIYTAVTRGVDQVVLVGDLDAAITAIKAPAAAARRHVMLPSLLTKGLK